MELFTSKCVYYAFLLNCFLLLFKAHSVEKLNDVPKVRGANLGGWLVLEGWIKPSLFDSIPNKNMLDGTKVQFKSVPLQKYVSAENGGGSNVSADRDTPSSWEQFRLWRLSHTKFQLRTLNGQFLSCDGEGALVTASAESPSATETFYIERNDNNKVHIRLLSGAYLQVSSSFNLTADYPGTPGWDDNRATFEMDIVHILKGDYQLGNAYGYDKANEVLTNHRSSFITEDDFKFMSQHGINTVRIPVGWWIALDPNPPAPFIGGTLAALDNAFSWAKTYNINCIVDLHAAPGSQNGQEHSASRDGSTDWSTSPDYISQSLDAIDFLASRFANHPALLGIELLNEPSYSQVPLNVLVSYYSKGYDIVRKYSSTAYVIISQRIGTPEPAELFHAKIGASNLVVDVHYYNLFDTSFQKMGVSDNIDYIYKSRKAELNTLNAASNALVFVGEWVNEMEFRQGSQLDYQQFGKAQLDVYSDASFGWAYWTLKNNNNHWDLKWNIQNNYLLLNDSQNK
ncbi:Glucan 1,3-beta-glucosidase [Thalictrum thalictroides]|uniref:Glucan 1,3-beta-glucosidase n=1 Tax=Thalictrum thalictroides TaxID=46969 RepID=A0A7J6WQL3_THATH|nr:Glucan 1,3-beta-glucosidase [Thalictrum thalictroides]